MDRNGWVTVTQSGRGFLEAKANGNPVICRTCGKRVVDNVPPDYRTAKECFCAVETTLEGDEEEEDDEDED
jgi:hypothetical protein